MTVTVRHHGADTTVDGCTDNVLRIGEKMSAVSGGLLDETLCYLFAFAGGYWPGPRASCGPTERH